MKRKRSEQTGESDDKVQKRKKSNVLKKVKERQRRSRISESISELKKLVPSCQHHKKLNQSLIMSMSVDYIRFLQKKIVRLETENELLKNGVPVDEDALPYVPEAPESTFTEYQKSKDHDLEVDIEMGRAEEMQEVNNYQEYVPVGSVDSRGNGMIQNFEMDDERNRNEAMKQFDMLRWGSSNEPAPSPFPNTVGGMLSQIPSMYIPGEKPITLGMELGGGFGSGLSDSMNTNNMFPALEQRENIGLPLFRENGQNNFRTMQNPQEKKKPANEKPQEQQFNNIDTYPTMGDIEDFGTWPLHSGIVKPLEVRNPENTFVPSLPQFREYS